MFNSKDRNCLEDVYKARPTRAAKCRACGEQIGIGKPAVCLKFDCKEELFDFMFDFFNSLST